MTDISNAMKADYLRVLSENKKLKQENANLSSMENDTQKVQH